MKIIALEIQIFFLSEMKIQLLKEEYEKKWSTNTAFPDASQTMQDARKEHFLNSLKMSSRGRLLRFLNRSDAQEFEHVLVCVKRFSDHVISKNEKRFCFIKKLKTFIKTLHSCSDALFSLTEALMWKFIIKEL